ncbi:hypothetical protein APSETT444_008332 [Aspergillus pseudonomiae]
MDLQVRLDQEWGAYTEKDTVSGHLIFRNKAPVNISTITVKLSGIATSRLNSGRYVESHQVDVELLNGQCLLLGYPIPLRIKLTKVGDRECFVWLNDFQTMLVGSTETHASGLVEKDTQFQVIQTMSNIHHVVSHDRALNGAELFIGDSLWNKHRLPITLTPSFETCNISQTYTLEVRLGLQCGYSKFRTTILEFSFPVYLAPPSMDPDPYEAKSAKLF